MYLSQKAIEALKSEKQKMKLAIGLDISLSTTRIWINEGNEKLTTIKSIEILKELTKLYQNELFQ